MMFIQSKDRGYRQLQPGIGLKSMAYGDKTLLTEVRLEKGSVIPWHNHPHEQTGYMVSGRMRFTIGQEVVVAEPGDSWSIPGNVYHSVDVLEDSLVIEVFSPVRIEYL